MNTPLQDIAQRFPTRLALIDGDREWTWETILHDAGMLADVLHREHAIQPGDTVATLLDNSAEHVILLHAIWLTGAAVAPLNTRLLRIERDRQLELLRPAMLVQTSVDAAPDPILDVPLATLNELFSAKPDHDFFSADFDFDQPCSVLFTSGSSGTPKAVPHSWQQHRASAVASAENLGVRDDDNWQCVIPLYHIGGLAILTRGVLHGIGTTLHDGFEPASIAETLRSRRITITSLVPTMLHRLLQTDPDLEGSRYPELRAILLGGAPASDRLLAEIKKRRLPVLSTYGMTESCSQVVTASPDAHCRTAGSAGRPLHGVELRICGENGKPLPGGMEGEIHLRGPMLTAGYLHHHALNSTRFADGWFQTGDMGVLGDDGCLRVLARREDMIISGGENIYPAEIVSVLLAHEDVQDAAVVGIDDEEWGQRPCAAVILSKGTPVDELDGWCRERLSAYKVPRHWRIVDMLPRTQTGKLLTGEVRKLFSRETI